MMNGFIVMMMIIYDDHHIIIKIMMMTIVEIHTHHFANVISKAPAEKSVIIQRKV